MNTFDSIVVEVVCYTIDPIRDGSGLDSGHNFEIILGKIGPNLTFHDPKLPRSNFLGLNPKSNVTKLMGPRPFPRSYLSINLLDKPI